MSIRLLMFIFYITIVPTAFAQGKIDNCFIKGELDDLPEIIRFDAPQYATVTLQIKKGSKGISKFPVLVGSINDSEALFCLEMFKKSNTGYDEKIKFIGDSCYNFIEGDSFKVPIRREEVVITSERWLWEMGMPLFRLFDITKSGNYKLVGYYRTICDGVGTLHKTDELYFEAK